MRMNDQILSTNGEMKEKSSHPPQFLKPIFPEYFKRISIPNAFHRYLVGEKSDIAILKSPRGDSWPVKVKGSIDGVFFEDGWGDFVAVHGLCSGDILVFRYEGNMVFDVSVFDKTACEKRYEKEMEKQGESKPEIHVEAAKVPQSGGQKVGFEGSRRYKPKGPHFVVTMNYTNLKYYFMFIPREFAVANRRLFPVTKSYQEKKQITLTDPKGRSFLVAISHRRSPRRNPSNNVDTLFSRGWRSFADSNNLEIGDECIFELMADDVMKVRIFRR
ncbi:B3 domain-containing protein REM10-like [Tasmannia lanceolata]|uniref:B3 domain-containing protein REM10-like n=1 Tax=Tasmannia lanceolata TaxID=3420 RepID=UPI0040628DA7